MRMCSVPLGNFCKLALQLFLRSDAGALLTSTPFNAFRSAQS